jgi:UDP-glucuronate 4-epimerase
MAILVTGCAGFIGMHVARALLARGESVIGIDNLNDYYDPALKLARLAELERQGGDFTFHRLDFADAERWSRAAGPRSTGSCISGRRRGALQPRAPATYIRSNLVGHANILELARQRQVGTSSMPVPPRSMAAARPCRCRSTSAPTGRCRSTPRPSAPTSC